MRDPVEFLTTGAFWPSVIQQESRGERVYDLPSRLLRERIIFITGPIDDNVAASICMQLLFLEAENPKKEISMYINSPGGVVTAGMARLDAIGGARWEEEPRGAGAQGPRDAQWRVMRCSVTGLGWAGSLLLQPQQPSQPNQYPK